MINDNCKTKSYGSKKLLTFDTSDQFPYFPNLILN